VDDSGWGEELEAASELSKMTKKDTFIQLFDQEQRDAESTIPIGGGRVSDPESPGVALKATFIATTASLIENETADIKVGNQSDVRVQEHQTSGV
jgi:hypothetical protein